MTQTAERPQQNVTRRTASLPSRVSRLTVDDTPSHYADLLGSSYVAHQTADHRKTHGLYLTPPPVAHFMAAMLDATPQKLRILDPAAGAGILLCAAVERLVALKNRPKEIDLVACEIDKALCHRLDDVLSRLASWAAKNGIKVSYTVRHEDFILKNAAALHSQPRETFDAVIANPPYFKIGKDDPRAVAASSVVHGQPNIYGLFMAVSAALLRSSGQLVFITPRSFASGPYFRQFRERFFSMMRPVHTHVFTSRRDAFSRDEVLQENVIFHGIRQDVWQRTTSQYKFTLSSSAGSSDLAHSVTWSGDIQDVLDTTKPGSVFRLPTSPEDEAILRKVDRWTGSLRAYGLQISTGPVVPFRATEFLSAKKNGATVPLLWMNHVHAMEIHWPNGVRKPQHIISKKPSEYLLLPNRNYVLIRRFSAKEQPRRLTAAPLLARSLHADMVGLENHLNYIHRPGGTLSEDEARGIAALYNSSLLDDYFRCINGNTQVSATELRAMPLPPLEEIIDLGKRVKGVSDPFTLIDNAVLDMTSRNENRPHSKSKGRSH